MYEYIQLEDVEGIAPSQLTEYGRDGWRVISVQWGKYSVIITALLERPIDGSRTST